MELELLLFFLGMIGFYRAGEFDAHDGGTNHGFLWAGSSALVSGIKYAIMGLGWQSWLLVQAGLFVGIAVVRVLLEDRENRRA
jgi:hypothetical protein